MVLESQWEYFEDSPFLFDVLLCRIGTRYDLDDEKMIKAHMTGGAVGDSRIRMCTSSVHQIIVGDIVQFDDSKFKVVNEINPSQSDIGMYILEEEI